MILYLDVVLFINLVMNFLILWFVGMVLNLKKSLWKIGAGAAIGCLFLLSVVSPMFAFFESVLSKIIISFLMIFISFSPMKIRDFIKISGFFYLISFMVGGGAFALFYFFDLRETIFNSILLLNHISIPWWILLVSSIVLFLFFKYLWPLIYHILMKDTLIVPIKIELGDKTLETNALIDTGNDLHDPISNYPVIIIEFEEIKSFFSPALQKILKESTDENLEDVAKFISNTDWAVRLRLIPFESIGRIKGLMLGFKPDCVMINFDNKILK
jgi:stage II sporulation protein GA (sporulation sigma-E factor processing peptidase)